MAVMAVLQGANNGCQVVALDVACHDNHVVSYAYAKYCIITYALRKVNTLLNKCWML